MRLKQRSQESRRISCVIVGEIYEALNIDNLSVDNHSVSETAPPHAKHSPEIKI